MVILVIVVEHDKDMMLASDYVIDMGLKAGLRLGGEVVLPVSHRRCYRRLLTSAIPEWSAKDKVPAVVPVMIEVVVAS